MGRDRKELADKLSEVDKLIKSIKLGCFNLGGNTIEKPGVLGNFGAPVNEPKPFPLKADLKMQVLKVIDALGLGSKLKDIQERLFELTKERHNIRETLRTLNKHELLKLLQSKGTIRGLYWVKTEWLEDNEGRLKNKHKFEGFQLLFTDEQIKFK